MPELDKVVTTALGVSLGFLFGLLSLYVKERIDFQRRASQARYAFLFLVSELCKYIQYDPSNYEHVRIETVTPYLDVVSSSSILRDVFEKIRPVYAHWKNREYFDQGVRAQEAIQQQKALEALAMVLDLYNPGIFWIR